MVNSVGKSMLSSMTEDEWEESETAVNAFTLVHHDLNMCTNSAQYVMLLDIINNLLLYSEPTQKVRKKSGLIFIKHFFFFKHYKWLRHYTCRDSWTL